MRIDARYFRVQRISWITFLSRDPRLPRCLQNLPSLYLVNGSCNTKWKNLINLTHVGRNGLLASKTLFASWSERKREILQYMILIAGRRNLAWMAKIRHLSRVRDLELVWRRQSYTKSIVIYTHMKCPAKGAGIAINSFIDLHFIGLHRLVYFCRTVTWF